VNRTGRRHGMLRCSLVALGLSAGGGVAQAAVLLVDDDLAQCPTAGFTTIQSAVNAALSGAAIRVCPGTYAEQVVISRPVKITGDNGAIVKPSGMTANTTSLFDASPIAAVILAMDAINVFLTGLTVDGADNGLPDCTAQFVGIFYRNASGKVAKAAVRNIRFGAGLETCERGLGIFAQSGAGGTSRVFVDSSSVHDYQKNGITGNEIGTDLRVTRSVVMGSGSIAQVTQNGVQVAYGALGLVLPSVVANHVYPPCVDVLTCGAYSSDVLVVDSDLVKVQKNTLGKSQSALFVQGNRAIVSDNTAYDTDVWDAIAFVGASNRALRNKITQSAESAVYLEGDKNLVSVNTINETPIGVWTFSGVSNIVKLNVFSNTDTPIEDSTVPRPEGGRAASPRPAASGVR